MEGYYIRHQSTWFVKYEDLYQFHKYFVIHSRLILRDKKKNEERNSVRQQNGAVWSNTTSGLDVIESVAGKNVLSDCRPAAYLSFTETMFS